MVVLAAAIVGIGTILWLLFRLFTVPGVVVHEFAHKWACEFVGVPVLEVAYFRLSDPPGYVRHAQPERYRETFVVSVAPFLVNTVTAFVAFLCLATFLETTGSIRAASGEEIVIAVVLGWLGLSVGMHAFPSTGDANSLWSRSRAEWRRSPTVLLAIPVVVVIYVANLLSWLGADWLYALGIGVVAFSFIGPPIF
ncbi:metalloprotease family protein [Natrinema halophilum]|nr:metalloprotease family protein [Natrinema halophilum]QLG49325.2 metalloprotease family protein [Natrinema halophilum]